MDLRAKSDQVPPLEEKCIRAIVSGSLFQVCEAEQYMKENVDRMNSAAASLESARRTLNRVSDLVSTLVSVAKVSDTWIYEVSAYLHKSTGQKSLLIDVLMKEYRALQSIAGWESNDTIFSRLCQVIDELASLYLSEDMREESLKTVEMLKRFRYLLQGVIRKVRSAYYDQSNAPSTAIEKIESYVEKINGKLV
jgi:hypothetical protein